MQSDYAVLTSNQDNRLSIHMRSMVATSNARISQMPRTVTPKACLHLPRSSIIASMAAQANVPQTITVHNPSQQEEASSSHPRIGDTSTRAKEDEATPGRNFYTKAMGQDELLHHGDDPSIYYVSSCDSDDSDSDSHDGSYNMEYSHTHSNSMLNSINRNVGVDVKNNVNGNVAGVPSLVAITQPAIHNISPMKPTMLHKIFTHQIQPTSTESPINFALRSHETRAGNANDANAVHEDRERSSRNDGSNDMEIARKVMRNDHSALAIASGTAATRHSHISHDATSLASEKTVKQGCVQRPSSKQPSMATFKHAYNPHPCGLVSLSRLCASPSNCVAGCPGLTAAAPSPTATPQLRPVRMTRTSWEREHEQHSRFDFLRPWLRGHSAIKITLHIDEYNAEFFHMVMTRLRNCDDLRCIEIIRTWHQGERRTLRTKTELRDAFHAIRQLASIEMLTVWNFTQADLASLLIGPSSSTDMRTLPFLRDLSLHLSIGTLDDPALLHRLSTYPKLHRLNIQVKASFAVHKVARIATLRSLKVSSRSFVFEEEHVMALAQCVLTDLRKRRSRLTLLDLEPMMNARSLQALAATLAKSDILETFLFSFGGRQAGTDAAMTTIGDWIASSRTLRRILNKTYFLVGILASTKSHLIETMRSNPTLERGRIVNDPEACVNDATESDDESEGVVEVEHEIIAHRQDGEGERRSSHSNPPLRKTRSGSSRKSSPSSVMEIDLDKNESNIFQDAVSSSTHMLRSLVTCTWGMDESGDGQRTNSMHYRSVRRATQ